MRDEFLFFLINTLDNLLKQLNNNRKDAGIKTDDGTKV